MAISVQKITTDWDITSDHYISGLFANLVRDRVVPSCNLEVVLEPMFEPLCTRRHSSWSRIRTYFSLHWHQGGDAVRCMLSIMSPLIVRDPGWNLIVLKLDIKFVNKTDLEAKKQLVFKSIRIEAPEKVLGSDM